MLKRVNTFNNFKSSISGDDEESILDYTLSDRPLCDRLKSIFWNLTELSYYYGELWNYYKNSNPLLAKIYFSITLELTNFALAIQRISILIGYVDFIIL